jgi:hypothetical protein
MTLLEKKEGNMIRCIVYVPSTSYKTEVEMLNCTSHILELKNFLFKYEIINMCAMCIVDARFLFFQLQFDKYT